ncbi:uncharacterized protein GGS22DRAFT_187669 [Annulohypoxylon maeteangense]|uniref:uncharacterized protein n=1 Tax=Annulohypoxylon maeteangense TaxID=1927788 RepID=UPI00200767A7|nr:uncharacterized protein GGS22DRAFT_187669 [Annulohypoxylon maeteangense]KAI0886425.1 hypothetical protein GGS22DRAFT_187669 [Annulohypoxylon maeteangense]
MDNNDANQEWIPDHYKAPSGIPDQDTETPGWSNPSQSYVDNDNQYNHRSQPALPSGPTMDDTASNHPDHGNLNFYDQEISGQAASMNAYSTNHDANNLFQANQSTTSQGAIQPDSMEHQLAFNSAVTNYGILIPQQSANPSHFPAFYPSNPPAHETTSAPMTGTQTGGINIQEGAAQGHAEEKRLACQEPNCTYMTKAGAMTPKGNLREHVMFIHCGDRCMFPQCSIPVVGVRSVRDHLKKAHPAIKVEGKYKCPWPGCKRSNVKTLSSARRCVFTHNHHEFHRLNPQQLQPTAHRPVITTGQTPVSVLVPSAMQNMAASVPVIHAGHPTSGPISFPVPGIPAAQTQQPTADYSSYLTQSSAPTQVQPHTVEYPSNASNSIPASQLQQFAAISPSSIDPNVPAPRMQQPSTGYWPSALGQTWSPDDTTHPSSCSSTTALPAGQNCQPVSASPSREMALEKELEKAFEEDYEEESDKKLRKGLEEYLGATPQEN